MLNKPSTCFLDQTARRLGHMCRVSGTHIHMRIVQHNVSDAAQLKLAVLQAFFELGPVQLHRWAHGLVLFLLLPLAVLDILHVDVEEHVRQTVVNVRAMRMRTRVGAAVHARRAERGI